MSDPIEEALLTAYEKGGQYAVYELVERDYPGWPWSTCELCDDETPTWPLNEKYDLCAVCFSMKPTQATTVAETLPHP